MTNLINHYKAVRARLNSAPAPAVKNVKAPKPVEDYVMPKPVPETPISVEDMQRRRLKNCPLSIRRKAIVLPILEEFDTTWEKLWAKDRRAVMHPPRRKVWLKLWEDGMSLPQIGRFTQRDHTTVLWGIRAIMKEKSEDKACTTATL
jgi:hypothetical protein